MHTNEIRSAAVFADFGFIIYLTFVSARSSRYLAVAGNTSPLII